MSKLPDERTLFNEAGIVLTTTRLSGGGHEFQLAKIKSVELKAIRLQFLGIKIGEPTFCFVVLTLDGGSATVLETKDYAFVQRVGDAVSRAWEAYRKGHK